MNKVQFGVLYREFLFRMLDRDSLSPQAQGDANKLFGRFAAFLVWISGAFALMAFSVPSKGARQMVLTTALAPEHAIIATTMLIVSLFAVLSWDSMFPDRRDVMILTPLPLHVTTIVLAKTAALAAALGVSVAMFNGLPGVVLPFTLTPPGSSFLDMLFSFQWVRTLGAYWVTMLLAGAFILCSVVCLQAAAAQFPRAVALRLSSILQITTFCVCVITYFLQPWMTSPEKVSRWLPPYWFLGLFQQLNGFPDGPLRSTLVSLGTRAWIALAISASGAVAAFLLACFRTLRKIAEQPDIVPTGRKRNWGMRFGNALDTAIVQFSIRTLVRSRQHRVLVAFYTGVGFAIVILFLHVPLVQVLSTTSARNPWQVVSLALLGSSFVMIVCWIAGINAAFAIPSELRANWVFRITALDKTKTVAASRKAFYAIGFAPCWIFEAGVFLWLWPWRTAAEHILVLGLLGTALSCFFLHGFHKIPFTCSYLPGKSNVHITLALCLMLGLNITFWAASYERQALFDFSRYLTVIAGLTAATGLAWWRMYRKVSVLRFDEEAPPAIISLALH